MTSIRTVSVIEAVAERMRDEIFDGTFRPGDFLVETHLAERYQVPRPTVRSAIVSLMHDGLLRRQPNRSVYVPQLSAEGLSDLFAVRKLVELEAVRRLSPLRKPSRELEHAVRMMEVLSEDDGWDEVLKYDFEFHSALVEATGSERLQKFFRSISAEMRLALTYFRSVRSSAKQIAGEHRELLRLLTDGNGDEVMAAFRTHIEEAEVFIAREIQDREVTASRPPSAGD